MTQNFKDPSVFICPSVRYSLLTAASTMGHPPSLDLTSWMSRLSSAISASGFQELSFTRGVTFTQYLVPGLWCFLDNKQMCTKLEFFLFTFCKE